MTRSSHDTAADDRLVSVEVLASVGVWKIKASISPSDDGVVEVYRAPDTRAIARWENEGGTVEPDRPEVPRAGFEA